MKKVTDRYHKLIDKPQAGTGYPDIKHVSKRAYQLGIFSLLTGITLAVIDAYIGLYVSSFLVCCFCFAMLMFLVLKYSHAIKNLTLSVIALICGLLITSAILEGLRSEQFLYFFPLLISVPILVDLRKTTYKQLFTYIFLIILSCGICVMIGRYSNPVSDFSIAQIDQLALCNRIIAVSSTIVLAFAYLVFEKKYIYELMEESNRIVDSRTQFLATIGHELRTPLNGIIGVVNILSNDKRLHEHKEYLKVLNFCSDHMLQQVNNILDYKKIEVDKLSIHSSPLNVYQFLHNLNIAFRPRFEEKNIALIFEIEAQLNMNIMADDFRLNQIFNNLISNALKFTERGHVKVSANLLARTEKSVSVRFEVEDTGIGIDKIDHGKIFESFWQVYSENTKTITGSGLGLTICANLLKLMKSKLNISSSKGKGSRFFFDLVLPIAKKNDPADLAASDELKQLSNIKILLVEDNEINMMVAKKCLTDFKANVKSAYNGQEALDELNISADYDIILMDLEMPVMNGYSAIFEIKKSFPNLPVIAFTASLVDDKMRADLLASGFSDCMLKPFKPANMLSTIQKQLQQQATRFLKQKKQ